MQYKAKLKLGSVNLSLSEDEFQTLSNICEAARVYLEQNKHPSGVVGQFRPETARKMSEQMDLIFSMSEEFDKVSLSDTSYTIGETAV